jgi:hypothetical protein
LSFLVAMRLLMRDFFWIDTVRSFVFFVAAMLGFSAHQLPNCGAQVSDGVSPLLSAVYFCFGIYPTCWASSKVLSEGQ